MKTLSQFACCAALWCFCVPGFAVELGVAGFIPLRTKPASLATIQAQAQLRGLRLRAIRWDAVLHQSWAVLEDMQHPERPLWAELTDPVGTVSPTEGFAAPGQPSPISTVSAPPVAVVHYGDRVRLWRVERNVRIEMGAIAEGSAAAGEELKLRIPSSGVDGDTGWRVVGLVHGPGDVEMTQ